MNAKAHSTPAISYDAALAQFVGWHEKGGNARVSTVRACPAQIFASMCWRAARTCKDPEVMKAALKMLHWQNTVDRWFAMNQLQAAGAQIFWCNSYVDARVNQNKEDEQ